MPPKAMSRKKHLPTAPEAPADMFFHAQRCRAKRMSDHGNSDACDGDTCERRLLTLSMPRHGKMAEVH